MHSVSLSVLVLSALLCVSYAAYTPPNKAGVMLDDYQCLLDSRFTPDTLANYKNGTYLYQIKEFLWATACGRSRGVFTLTNSPEYAGSTYSCANWPEQWGIKNIDDWFKTPDVYEQHLEYLSLYIQGNFNTTAVHDAGTCDFAGFSTGYCGDEERYSAPYKVAPWAEKLAGKAFRGVNTGGLFLLEPWITPQFTNWSLEIQDEHSYDTANPEGSDGYEALLNHWDTWYTNDDFKQMSEYGLNAVRIPVGWWFFADEAKIPRDPYHVPKADINDPNHPLTKMIKMAQANNLVVVLDLHGAPGSQNGLDNSGLRSDDKRPERWGWTWLYDQEKLDETTEILKAMAKYITMLESNGVDNIAALELLNEPWVFLDMSRVRDWYKVTIQALREITDMPLVIHDAFRHIEWDWLLTDFPYENVYMDTHIYHAFNADDIASSEPDCDKNKAIVAQNIACGYGSMLRFKTCLSLPVFVGEWSLAIDDCVDIIRGAEISIQFRDFGQCNNLEERIGDPWWILSYRKFALKQMAMAERELGWFFWTWKMGPGGENDPSAPYWSYSLAVESEIIPSPLLDEWVEDACYEFEDTRPYTC